MFTFLCLGCTLVITVITTCFPLVHTKDKTCNVFIIRLSKYMSHIHNATSAVNDKMIELGQNKKKKHLVALASCGILNVITLV